jgi:hypothetical protein
MAPTRLRITGIRLVHFLFPSLSLFAAKVLLSGFCHLEVEELSKDQPPKNNQNLLEESISKKPVIPSLSRDQFSPPFFSERQN